MPTSHLHQLNEIVELIVLTNPRRLLDVGMGFGKYGVLAREYLELRDGRGVYGDWQRRIDGIEAFAAYVTPLHHFIYDHIYIGDALHLIPTLPERYDLILLIDVLEHFTPEDGRLLLQHGCRQARNVLVSTPRQFIPQQDSFGNEYETHRSHWRDGDFAGFAPACPVPNDYSLIYYLGEDSARVRRQLFSLRRRIKRSAPFLLYPYRAVRRWTEARSAGTPSPFSPAE